MPSEPRTGEMPKFNLSSLRRLLGGDETSPMRRHPHPKATGECVRVVSSSASLRQAQEVIDITSAQDDVIRLQGSDQARHNVGGILAPFFLAIPLETSDADIVFKRRVFIR